MYSGTNVTGELDMSIPQKMEYELEILTLAKNIEKFKQLGLKSENLQSRLDYCLKQFDELLLSESNQRIERK